MLSLVKTNDTQSFKDTTHLLNESLTLADVHKQAKVKRLLSEVAETYLDASWSISKAKDTYGYNRVQVQDAETGKRFSACGGGYDMLGSAFGEWLQHTHQDLLLCYSGMAHDVCEQMEQGKPWTRQTNKQGLYGMTLNTRQGVKDVSLDGGCGLDCMLRIAKHIGLELQPVKSYNRKGQSTGIKGWHVSVKECS